MADAVTTTSATTSATVAHGGEHAEPTLFGLGAETWVYVSVFIFLLLAVFVGKLPQRIVAALDERIAGVRRQLDEARALRAEAEALRAEAQASAARAEQDAAAIIARAQAEAERMLASAEDDAAATVARLERLAEVRIAAAARAAEGALRARAARMATAAARDILTARAAIGELDGLTDQAIAGLAR